MPRKTDPKWNRSIALQQFIYSNIDQFTPSVRLHMVNAVTELAVGITIFASYAGFQAFREFLERTYWVEVRRSTEVHPDEYIYDLWVTYAPKE